MKRQTHDGTWHDFDAQAEQNRAELIALGAPMQDVNDMVACDLQRDAAIANGQPYYDYDRQCWVNT